MQLFKERLMNATIRSTNEEQFKLDLSNAIEKSYLYDNDDEQHPVITYLSEMNSKQNGGGWLFQLGARMSHSRTNNDIFLATVLYSIVGCRSNSDYCEILVDALRGSTATKQKSKKPSSNLLQVSL